MQLIELLLPLQDNHGTPFPRGIFRAIQIHLTETFGGATAFTRAPADGTTTSDGQIEDDQIIVFEVMTEGPDRNWWRNYRTHLEHTFRQREIVIRTHQVELL